MASICCSPPERVPPACRITAPAGRETARRRTPDLASASRSLRRVGAEDEIVAHRQSEPKICRPSGAWEMPRATISCEGSAVEIGLPSKVMRAAAGSIDAGDGAQRRRLAGAVGADMRHQLALANFEGDAFHRLRSRRSKRARRAGRRRRSGSRRPGCIGRRDTPRSPVGLPRISPGVPSAMTRP